MTIPVGSQPHENDAPCSPTNSGVHPYRVESFGTGSCHMPRSVALWLRLQPTSES